jgi:hypothetical protein
MLGPEAASGVPNRNSSVQAREFEEIERQLGLIDQVGGRRMGAGGQDFDANWKRKSRGQKGMSAAESVSDYGDDDDRNGTVGMGYAMSQSPTRGPTPNGHGYPEQGAHRVLSPPPGSYSMPMRGPPPTIGMLRPEVTAQNNQKVDDPYGGF